MKAWTQKLTFILMVVFATTTLFATEAPEGSKNKANATQAQPGHSTKTLFSYLIKGYAEKIVWTSDGTMVSCKGSAGTCIAVDFETGVAVVDPDGCNMGPTYIGCEKVDGNYFILVKQTPEVSIWKLYEQQQISIQSIELKPKKKDAVDPVEGE